MILEQWLVRGRKMPRETKPLRRTLPVPNVVPCTTLRMSHQRKTWIYLNLYGESLFLTHHPQGQNCGRVREEMISEHEG
jgi:hypothetical protein